MDNLFRSQPKQINELQIFFNAHQRIYLLIFRERKGEGERERERNIDEKESIDQLPPICDPTRDPTHTPGLCPDQGLNPQPLGVQDEVPTTRAICPGLSSRFLSPLFWFGVFLVYADSSSRVFT